MLEETVILLVIMAFNLIIIIGMKIAVLQIAFALVSAVIAISLVNVVAFPFLNILLILICIAQAMSAIVGVKK